MAEIFSKTHYTELQDIANICNSMGVWGKSIRGSFTRLGCLFWQIRCSEDMSPKQPCMVQYSEFVSKK